MHPGEAKGPLASKRRRGEEPSWEQGCAEPRAKRYAAIWPQNPGLEMPAALHEWAASCRVMPGAAASPACLPPAFPKDGVLGVVIILSFAKAAQPLSSLPSLQGDGNIRYYEIGSEKPYLSYLMEFRSPAPQKGLGKDGRAAAPARAKAADGRCCFRCCLKMGLAGVWRALCQLWSANAGLQRSGCPAALPAALQPGWGWLPRTPGDTLPAVPRATALPGDISQ